MIRAGRTVARGHCRARSTRGTSPSSWSAASSRRPRPARARCRDEVLLEVDRARGRTDGEARRARRRLVPGAPRRDRRHRRRRGQRPERAARGHHGHRVPLDAGIIRSPDATSRRLRHPRASRAPVSATSPRIATTTVSSSPAPLWENVMLGHQTQAPFVAGPWIDKGGRDRAHPRDHRAVRRAHPGARRPRLRPLGRQPAEADHRSRDAHRAVACSLASHPTRGIDVGAQAAVWDIMREARKRRPGDAARLGRPRRAHRPQRHAARHLRVDASSQRSTRRPSRPVELGSYMTAAHTEEGVGGVNEPLGAGDRRPGRRGDRLARDRVDRAAHQRPQPARRLQGDVELRRLDRVGRRDPQPGRPVLRLGPRRRHRLQDGPVQHRRRRPVPARGAVRGHARRRGVACRRVLHVAVHHHRGDHRRWRSMPGSPACSRSAGASTR